MSVYPVGAAPRDRFILDRRPQRRAHDPWRAQGVVTEDERAANGTVARVATVFLTGRECPWRCLMCDPWQYTTPTDTPVGAIPSQIAAARATLDDVECLKLYNAGSFFDPRAVPEGDYDAIAMQLAGLQRVIVESHPALVGARTSRFLEALERHRGLDRPPPTLEVAMGLETVHDTALERLNKKMTVEEFAVAAGRLQALGVALRVFLLVSPPFVPTHEQDDWLLRAVGVACDAGASAISLIPTRAGNGALDAIAADGAFQSPTLADLERSLDLALASAHGSGTRIFADLWDLERLTACAYCVEARRERLRRINHDQRTQPTMPCAHCASHLPS
jgi:radical SAM enzyme (TIGR01210 family)